MIDPGFARFSAVTSVGRTLVILAALANCATIRAGQPATQDLFADPQFRRGFALSFPDSSKGRAVEAVLGLGDTNNVPAWRLCQWASQYSLAGVLCRRGTDGDLLYENQGKRVVVGAPGRRIGI